MGVDFYGYSNVRTEPVPNEFRALKTPLLPEERADIEESIRSAQPGLRELLMSTIGASYAPDGALIICDKVEISEETTEKLYNLYENNEDFLDVCWYTNTIYFATPYTMKASTGRSYSGYDDFCRELTRLNGGKPLAYMPPSTDSAPECGFVSTDKCILCLQGLNSVRKFFVSDSWLPDMKAHVTHLDDMIVPPVAAIHDDSWFFREFYSAVSAGADSGYLTIS
jgi:hypothetical protein